MPTPFPLSFPKLENLTKRFPTPFHLYDEKAIRSACYRLKAAFQKNFPDFQQFFAVKALPNPAILKIMKSEGFGLDCSSESELFIAKKLSFQGEKIMFTSNYTSQKELAQAFDQKVIINLDDISLIDNLIAARQIPQLICFRLNPGIGATDSETKSNVLGGPRAKYGIPPFQIIAAYEKAKKLGAKHFGIHMMTGSCVLKISYFVETVSILLDTMGQIKKALKINFDFFNIGGGFGIPYKPNQKELDIEKLSNQLKKVYDAKTKKFQLGKPKLYMENGRFLTGPYGWLVSRCQAIKKSWQKYYGLDACMANLMRPGMYDAYHHIEVPALNKSVLKRANIVGTLCENNDWFAHNRLLPEARVNDLFIIHDTGAHGHAMGFQYNGKLRSAELLLRLNGQVDLIRQAETPPDLFANTVIPKNL